jgi:hypothetical protein
MFIHHIFCGFGWVKRENEEVHYRRRVVSCVVSCRVCSVDDIYRIRKRISIYSLMMVSVSDCDTTDIKITSGLIS